MDGVEVHWSARRPAPRPAGGPKIHEFTPVAFHRRFSGTIEPVLRLFPGDSVRTWSVDAGGTDAHGKRRVFGGNPLTGPFYIEGAMPGDTLVVRLDRVRLNRDSARSGSMVVGSALDPYYLKDLKRPEKFDSEWSLDREKGVARLKNPTERLKNYTVALQPMLGCIGVAPPGAQSFLSGDLGGWGGNLDYNQMREGVTVYLPVYQPGALLFLGDGHAAQGDGELTGDALETSMDIGFTVDVKQNARIGEPRIENGEYIMFSGVANSLPEALQDATTAATRYISTEYKLNPAEAAIVMGTAVKYEIAEIVDPRVHVVAKLAKSALAPLAAR